MNRVAPVVRRAVPAMMLATALAACATSAPLGTPVPTRESVTVRGELAAMLLRSGRYEEAAREYWHLVRLDDGNAAYRLGLARALAWSGRHREAEHHLRIVASIRPRDAGVDSLLRSVRANLLPAVPEARSWVAERPGYPPYRIALARALAAEGRLEEALEEYGRLLATVDDPGVLVDRARLHIRRKDHAAAEADLRRSLAIEQTVGAWLALGDLHRWRGRFGEARTAYRNAAWLSPGDPDARAAFARLVRDERPPQVAMRVPGQESGWGLTIGLVRDNAGIGYTRIAARRGFMAVEGFTGSVGVEVRDLSETTASDTMASRGVAADVAVARSIEHRALFGTVGVRAGAVRHGAALLATAGVGLRGGYRAWVAALDLETGPAYPALLTGASLTRPEAGAGPLRERGLTLAVGGPVGAADAAIRWQRADISDGNRRSAVELSGRYPFTRRLSAVYTGTGIAYEARSPLYWDPDGYVANAFGIEVADRRVRGLSYAGRARAGLAWSETAPFLRGSPDSDDPDEGGAFLQLGLGGEIGFRGDGWEIAASYGFGQVSGYRRSEATFIGRFTP